VDYIFKAIGDAHFNLAHDFETFILNEILFKIWQFELICF